MFHMYYHQHPGRSSPRDHQHRHQVSHPWWERGAAFYLFLPLNVSSAAIRFAGDKVKSILEDSENEVAINQRKKIQYQKQLAAQQQHQQHQPQPSAPARRESR
jgi:hypothetical protein